MGVAIRKAHAVSAARRQCTPKSLRAIDGKEKLSVCCGGGQGRGEGANSSRLTISAANLGGKNSKQCNIRSQKKG